MLEFVADVRPLYRETNMVVVPTLESAGTNVKVLEALAMERAVVSTPSGCAGLGLEHGVTAWIADSAAGLAEGIKKLLDDGALRASIAQAGRDHAKKHFDWRAIGRRQRGAAAGDSRRSARCCAPLRRTIWTPLPAFKPRLPKRVAVGAGKLSAFRLPGRRTRAENTHS